MKKKKIPGGTNPPSPKNSSARTPSQHRKARLLKKFPRVDRVGASASLPSGSRSTSHLPAHRTIKKGSQETAPQTHVSPRNRRSGTPQSKMRKLSKKYPKRLARGVSREGNSKVPKMDVVQNNLS